MNRGTKDICVYVFKITARVFIFMWCIWLVLGPPQVCPPAILDSSLTSEIIGFGAQKEYIESVLLNLFPTIKADTIGVFLVDDSFNYLIKVAYIDEMEGNVLDSNLYPIFDKNQKDVYKDSFVSGCVSRTIDDIPEGSWKTQLNTVGVKLGIVCSFKSPNVPSNKLKGIITFEYKQNEPDISTEYVINSIRYYRQSITDSMLSPVDGSNQEQFSSWIDNVRRLNFLLNDS